MRITTLAMAGLLAGTALVAAPVRSFAQRTGRGSLPQSSTNNTEFDLTPYAGYMVFGDYLSGPLGTSVHNAPAAIFGVQAGMRVSPTLSMIANVASASSDIQVGLPYLGGFSMGSSSVLMYDAGLQLDMPVTTTYGSTLSPFVQAGVGGMHYSISESVLTTTATNLAGNVGLGADLKVGQGLGIRVMAKDYFGKFNFQDATSVDYDAGVTQNFAFSAGMRFSF